MISSFLSFACSDTDVHTVASLLKLYLRELPVPVVPWTQYHDFLSCTESLDSEVCLEIQLPTEATSGHEMSLTLLFPSSSSTPRAGRSWSSRWRCCPGSTTTSSAISVGGWGVAKQGGRDGGGTRRMSPLRFLLPPRSFLFEVQRHAAVNKMNVENLATVMGINLLKPQIEDPFTMMKGGWSAPAHIPAE